MANENSNYIKENLDSVVVKFEGQIAELREENAELKKDNNQLKDQNMKLMQEMEAIKAKQMKRSIGIDSNDLCAEEIIDPKKSKSTKRCTSFVPNWLVEVMAWIKRMEMANSALIYSSWTFKQLCWPKLHENVKDGRILPGLYFVARKDKFGHFQAKLARIDEPNRWLPIPSIPPPHYITGINKIKIFFLDRHVMHFLECIHSIIAEIYFNFNVQRIPAYRYCPKGICQLRRFFEMFVSKSVAFSNPYSLDFIRSYPNADAIMENFESIKTFLDTLNMNFLVRWLAKFRADQKPKKLDLNLSYMNGDKSGFVSRIKEEFIRSSKHANFIILFMFDRVDTPNFTVENENTGEILALYENANHNNLGIMRRYLVRHPKGSDHLRAEWERQIHQPLEELPTIYAHMVEIGEF